MKENQWAMYEKYIEPRMDKLFREKQYLELMLFMGAILENELRDVNLSFERFIDKMVRKHKMRFTIKKLPMITI